MTAATFDTRTAAKALQASGFTEPQAAAAVDMVRDAMAEGVATKADLRAEIAELKAYLAFRIYGAALGAVALLFGLLKLV